MGCSFVISSSSSFVGNRFSTMSFSLNPQALIHLPFSVCLTSLLSCLCRSLSDLISGLLQLISKRLVPYILKCTCESINPGSNDLPFKSITFVVVPIHFLIVSERPTSYILLSFIDRKSVV